MTDSKSSISSGLDAIFNATTVPVQTEAEHTNTPNIQWVERSLLIPSSYQPRNVFDEATLQELAQSISQHGILQPILVKQRDHQYEIIAGERRFRAAGIAGLKRVPVVVYQIPEQSILAFALIENIQRQNLTVVEEAKAYQTLLTELNLSHELIAQKVGKSRSHVTNMIRLLSLPDDALSLLENAQISMGHARAILTLPSDQQQQALQRIVDEKLNVREAEMIAKRSVTPPPATVNPHADVRQWLETT